jgi:hypothetical protein
LGQTIGIGPGFPRTGFNSSRLVRLLADCARAQGSAPAVGADATPTFAERLSPWLDWTDAIALSAALSRGAAAAAQPHPGGASGAGSVIDVVTRVRADLAGSIGADTLFSADAQGKAAQLPAAGVADFSPYRRCCQVHQRAMEARIGPLRAQVRSALSALSPALGRVAALDAALDQALAARERHLLAKVPALLEQRFRRLGSRGRTGHGDDAATAGGQGLEPSRSGQQPAVWLADFGRDMQAVLLAELDLRLQPVEGMVDAFRNEATGRQ